MTAKYPKGTHQMTAQNPHSRRALTLRITAASAMVAGLLVAASTPALAHKAAPSDNMAAQLAAGHFDQAIASGEAAVAANPRDAAARAALGHAYLRGGRFESAAAVLADAQGLGDTSGRTALALALAQIALGKGHDAIEVLDAARSQLPVADYGLAIALAGDSARGVGVLTDDLHAGDRTSTLRENLGYAYALDGRWGEARTIVAMDLPADKVDARITQWASNAQPEAYRGRVAGLLGAPVRDDAGMPSRLALNAAPATTQMAMNSPVATPAASPVQGELPAVDSAPAPRAMPVMAENTPAPAAPAAAYTAPSTELFSPNSQAPQPVGDAPSFASVTPMPMPMPMMASVPAHPHAAAHMAAHMAPKHASAAHGELAIATPAPHKPDHAKQAAHPAPAHLAKAAPAADAYAHVAMKAPVSGENGGHNVQLGSFASEKNAERARKLALAKDADLGQRHIAITSAVVKGHTFWRVTASGFDTASAAGTCGTIRHQGGACWAYEASHLAPSLAMADTHAAAHHAVSARAHRR